MSWRACHILRFLFDSLLIVCSTHTHTPFWSSFSVLNTILCRWRVGLQEESVDWGPRTWNLHQLPSIFTWCLPLILESICVPFPVLFILVIRLSGNSRDKSSCPGGGVSTNLHPSGWRGDVSAVLGYTTQSGVTVDRVAQRSGLQLRPLLMHR